MKKLLYLGIVFYMGISCNLQAGTYSGGDGSEATPFLIADANDMQEIGAEPNDWDKYFLLTNDINLAQFTGTQFNRIGLSSSNSFTGVFDGNNHTISNFTYNSPGTNRVSLFSYISDANAVIKNLGLIDPNVRGREQVGCLAGYINDGTVSNCFVEGGSISGDYDTGGLIGYSKGNVISSYATCAVFISWSGTGAGGLVGINLRDISDCYATGTVNGGEKVGGLVGDNYGLIGNSYATGAVTGKYDVGGLVGGDSGGWLITNSYATGAVTGDGWVGGLIGWNGDGSISNSYATGAVDGGQHTGGLVGENDIGSISNSYWDIDTSGQQTSDGGEGKATNQMRQEATFTNWDFTTPIWVICEGTNYPKLAWQLPVGDFVCPDGVNFIDFSVLGLAWLSEDGDGNWNPLCDISEPNDNIIDTLDLDVFSDNWLVGK